MFAVITTGTSTGSVNSMHDSYTPLGGMIPLVMIQLGEVVFGGVGAGLYGILVFAIIAVFIAGLMVGRTPGVPGQEDRDVRDEDGVAGHPHPGGRDPFRHGCRAFHEGRRLVGIANPGPHGLTEILYAFSSGTGNNGSAFAGLARTPGSTTSAWR